MSSMKNLIIGTAGHIDHGKTALIRALTGVDTDRLREEKERGITIDIGFADLQNGEYRLGFIDVPGHERFVKNMLAGIGGIRLVMLVVAADESVMPQTLEHFQICRLLRVRRGIIVLTKCDLVDGEILELVREEVRDLVRGSFLENAPCLAVDSLSGTGIEELKSTLDKVVAEMDRDGLLAHSEDQVFRLAVDRVFTIRGFGTVVTGTAQSGSLRKDSTVEIHPASRVAKVRGIQIFGRDTDVAHAGQRTAINLSGVEKDLLYRGSTLFSPGRLKPTQVIDVEVEMLADAPAPLRYRSPIRFHHGSSEIIGRIYLLEGEELKPGRRGLAQIRLDSPAVCLPGDRFVLRRYSPLMTVGGGVILDNAAVKHRKKELAGLLPGLRSLCRIYGDESACRLDALEYHIRRSGPAGLDIDALVRRTGYNAPVIQEYLKQNPSLIVTTKDPPRYIAREHFEERADCLQSLLEKALADKPLSAGVSKEEIKEKLFKDSAPSHFQALLNRYADRDWIEIRDEFITLPGRQVALSARQEEIRRNLTAHLEKMKFQPCSLDELTRIAPADQVREVYFHLIRTGELIRITGDLVLLPSRLEKLIDRLRARFSGPRGFTVPEFKELTSLSRKHAIPVLEYLDRSRITRRAGDRRQLL